MRSKKEFITIPITLETKTYDNSVPNVESLADKLPLVGDILKTLSVPVVIERSLIDINNKGLMTVGELFELNLDKNTALVSLYGKSVTIVKDIKEPVLRFRVSIYPDSMTVRKITGIEIASGI